jgi:hypothetical protein
MTAGACVTDHGEVVICGDGPDGPSYTYEDGWTLFVPLDDREPVWFPPEDQPDETPS